MNCKFTLAAIAAATLSATTLAQDKVTAKIETEKEIKPLTIGDAARPIDISDWVKGDKVSKFELGKVYVVEFWATWCGPCKASMPHITGLQKDYKDYGVTFIGVSDEKLEIVTDFLKKTDKEEKTWDSKIGYTLTTDPDKSVYNDYFVAAGQRGIPTAFIIGKDLHIEWIGHPMGIDQPLEAVVKDSWDRGAYKAKWEKEQAAEKESMKTDLELRAAMKAKDWKKTIELLDAQIARNDKDFNPKFTKFMILLTEMDQPKDAYTYGEKIAKDQWEQAQPLNQIAWTVVDSPKVKTRDLDFAMRLATRANDLTDNKSGAIQDTLARVYFEKGDLANAVRIQKQAVENAEDSMADSIKDTLKKYEDALSKKK